jgi:hypothetical protein
MLVISMLLMTGCRALGVSGDIAYQERAKWAWNVLPISALIELTA